MKIFFIFTHTHIINTNNIVWHCAAVTQGTNNFVRIFLAVLCLYSTLYFHNDDKMF